MTLLQALLLSIIEGVTEFLPISSTGHLILATQILGMTQTEFVKSFEIVIQLGAILAVILLFWKTFIIDKKTLLHVSMAFIPTAILGFFLYRFIKDILFGNPWIVVLSLLLGGVFLILFEALHTEKQKLMTTRDAFLIGCFQAISMIPGVSRSGASVVGGLLLGVQREKAVTFSFLLAIPTMIAASGLDVAKNHMNFTSSEYSLLAIGFVGAFITARMTIRWFTTFVQTHTLTSFGVYRILVALMYYFFVLR